MAESENVLYFFEEIFPFFAVLVFQNKTTVGFYTQQSCHEFAICIFVRVESTAAEERACIASADFFGIEFVTFGLQSLLVDSDAFHYMVEHCCTVVFFSSDLLQ